MNIKLKQYRKISRLLETEKEVVCINKEAHAIVCAIALELLTTGKEIQAKVVAGYRQ